MNILLAAYLTDAQDRIGWSPKTIRAYGSHIRWFIAWQEKRTLAPCSPDDYTADNLQTYDTARKRAGKAQRTRAAELSAQQSFARYLAKHGHISQSENAAIADLKVRVTEKSKKVWAKAEQVQALFAACGRVGEHHGELLAYRVQLCYAVLAVLAYCGLRRSEVCNLQLTDIDLDGPVPQLTVRHGKGNKTRACWLHADAVKHLRAWIAHRPTDAPQLFAVPIYRLGSTSHAPMTEVRLLGILRELTRLADLPEALPLPPHAFRRFAATNLLKVRGCTLAHVCAFLGHSSIAVTLEYLDMESQELQQLVLQMEVEEKPKLKIVETAPRPRVKPVRLMKRMG